MVEPPGDFGRIGIFEIHNGIFFAIKVLFVKQRTGAVQQAGENELDVAANPFTVETGEKRCRRSAVKTFVVIEHPNSQACLPFRPESDRLPETEREMKVNREAIRRGSFKDIGKTIHRYDFELTQESFALSRKCAKRRQNTTACPQRCAVGSILRSLRGFAGNPCVQGVTLNTVPPWWKKVNCW